MSELCSRLLDCCVRAVRDGAHFADARAVEAGGQSFTIQDGRAERLSSQTVGGVGIRVLADGAWGFASTDSVAEPAMERARRAALDAARAAVQARRDPAPIAPVQPVVAEYSVPVVCPLDDWTVSRKLARLTELERAGVAAAEGCALNSVLSYSQGWRTVHLANSAGTQIVQSLSHCRVSYTITAAVGEVRQQAGEHKAHLGGLELLTELEPEQLSAKAAGKVLRLCRARSAPAGVMPVVFHPSATGLLAHEALGHNAEADTYYVGQSILRGRLGQQIAAPGVTIVDDSTIPGAYGSFAYDDEGTPSQRRIIVDGGVFRTLLHNLETAGRFGAAPNGCARADDHTSPPIVRMSNTFVLPDPAGPTADEIIRTIDRGLYVAEGQDGYVFPERGQFICRADSARLIEHGRLGDWVRDASVSGLLLETLTRIELVGRDFEMAQPGICSKLGQGAATDCGGPHLKVSRMTVGGTS